MIGLVAGPVLIGLVIIVALFILAGPAIANLARTLKDQITATIRDIKDVWRSKE
jgi:hypothetical protein